MKNKRFFFGVVVVFAVLGAFFAFYFGFKVVRAQFGVVMRPITSSVRVSPGTELAESGALGVVRIVKADVQMVDVGGEVNLIAQQAVHVDHAVTPNIGVGIDVEDNPVAPIPVGVVLV
jgi:hypothetical protein